MNKLAGPYKRDCLAFSAKGAKCDSLGPRPRTRVSSQHKPEGAKSKESETRDMPQSLSSILIDLITEFRKFLKSYQVEYDERYVWG
jgi:hypothetical protein